MTTSSPEVGYFGKAIPPPQESWRSFPVEERRKAGFSLPELLVAMLLLAVVVILGFSGMRQASMRAQRVDSIATLRSLGQMILQYAVEHRQTLPGPLKYTQHAWLNGQSSNQLSYRLLPYMPDGKNLRRGDIVRSMGSRRFFSRCDPFVHVPYVPNLARVGPADTHAWGYSGRDTAPQRIDYVPEASRMVAIIEADRELLGGAGNAIVDAQYASDRLFDDGRAGLFFDWHVEVLPLSYRLGSEPYR